MRHDWHVDYLCTECGSTDALMSRYCFGTHANIVCQKCGKKTDIPETDTEALAKIKTKDYAGGAVGFIGNQDIRPILKDILPGVVPTKQ
jgi:hypothetical protein